VKHEKLFGSDWAGEELPWKNNYFIGNDPSKWRTDVPNYSKIRLCSLYDGIDLVYHGNKNIMKYDFVVRPGATPGQIHLSYDFGGFTNPEGFLVRFAFHDDVLCRPIHFHNCARKFRKRDPS